jgi:hypothetical protein
MYLCKPSLTIFNQNSSVIKKKKKPLKYESSPDQFTEDFDHLAKVIQLLAGHEVHTN